MSSYSWAGVEQSHKQKEEYINIFDISIVKIKSTRNALKYLLTLNTPTVSRYA